MNLDLYHQETLRACRKYEAILTSVSRRLDAGEQLTDIEEQGVLHSLQVLIENAIGKAKHQLKAHNREVPVSGYEAFELMARHDLIPRSELQQWKKIIGLRNVLVHEYMAVNMDIVYAVVQGKQYELVTAFLRRPPDY